MKLNKEQELAVNTLNGPVVVIAGAGSGKTRVLTSRIIKLLESGVNEREILAITFTNKAAREMKERVNEVLKTDVFISTFHSFCYTLLRYNQQLLNFKSQIKIMDDADYRSLLNKINKDFELGIDFKKDYTYNSFNLYYIRKRYYGMSDRSYHPKQSEIETLYDKYLGITTRDGLLNFDDLLYLSVELLKKNKVLLSYYQNKYRYILVDEYQDTNDIQNDLILMLAKKHQNLFVVGDEDQSIYKFRGANLENLKNILHSFKDAKLIKLEENYRSTSAILNAANNVIQNNKDRIKKNLWTSNQSDELIKLAKFQTDQEELLFITNKIKELHERGVEYDKMAILYRSGYISRGIEQALRNNFIPFVTYGGYDFFKRVHIKRTINYLSAVTRPDDRFLILDIINYPSRKIGAKTLFEIERVLDENSDLGISDIFREAEKYYSPSLASKIKSFYQKILKVNQEINDLFKASEIIDILLKEFGLNKEYLSMEEGKSRIEDVLTLKDMIDEWDDFQNLNNIDVINLMLEETSAIYNYESKEDEKDRLVLSTMHMAKGLEFDYVFLPFFEENNMPSSRSIEESDAAIEEERRLCYVAITRAKKELFITNVTYRYIFGSTKYYEKSRFIGEIGAENILDLNEVAKEKKAKIKPIDIYKTITKTKYKMADKVEHKTFGLGIIVKIDGDILTIAFSVPHGVKTIMATTKMLKRV